MVAVSLLVIPQLAGTIEGLQSQESKVRIGAADPVAAMLIPLSALLLIALVLKAIPARPEWIDQVMRWFHLTLWISLALAVIGIPVSLMLQHQLMPKQGYTVCDETAAQRSLWFNDWVKDPALCKAEKAAPTRCKAACLRCSPGRDFYHPALVVQPGSNPTSAGGTRG